jgi:peptide deformylase
MILDILPEHHEMLHQPAQRFDFENPPMDPTELFENLKETLIAKRGMGLSAPQVGIPYQVFVIGNPGDPDSIFSVFNPKIVDYKGDTISMEESCLTFNGLFVKIKRPSEIRARFSGHDGLVNTMPMVGVSARLFQHEYDHINGITMTKRASSLHLSRAKKEKEKLDRLRKRNVK